MSYLLSIPAIAASFVVHAAFASPASLDRIQYEVSQEQSASDQQTRSVDPADDQEAVGGRDTPSELKSPRAQRDQPRSDDQERDQATAPLAQEQQHASVSESHNEAQNRAPSQTRSAQQSASAAESESSEDETPSDQ